MTKELISNMLNLQEEMQGIVNPEWKSAGYPFLRAVAIEVSELIDHHGWKWWKDIEQQPDTAQIKLEVVDIWHFLLSEAIVAQSIGAGDELEDLPGKLALYLEESKSHIKEDGNIIAEAEKLALCSLYCMNLEYIFGDLFLSFFVLMATCGMEIEELYKLYVAKNILNRFRQHNGYKEGTYQKELDGVEDNIVLMEILENNPGITPDDLYETFSDVYSSCTQ